MNYNKGVKWYNNGTCEIQVKPGQTIPEGFTKGRLPKPKKIDTLKSLITKEDLYRRYIVDNCSFIDLSLELSLERHELRELLNFYGIYKNYDLRVKNNRYHRSAEQTKEVGEKSSATQKLNWSDKSKEEKDAWSKKCYEIQLNLNDSIKKNKAEKYREYWNSLSKEQKDAINEKRRSTLKKTWSNNKEDILSRQKATEKENRKNRLCRSVSEQLMYDKLITLYDQVEYDVKKADRYPFFCDFYIPVEDLFIELNAHPSHGRLPFRYLTFEEYSKYPRTWVDVFAKRDVEKQKIAKENKLNYICIYPQATLEENIKINNKKYIELITMLHNLYI